MSASPKPYVPRDVTLRPAGVPADGWRRAPLEAVYRDRLWRFLLEDGTTVDVRAHQCSSDLSAAVLNATGAERIVGYTEITPVVPEPEQLALGGAA